MQGYFIYNRQLVSTKFLKLFDCFKNESEKLNIELTLIDNFEVLMKLNSDDFPVKDFVIFWDKDIKLAKMLEDAGHRLFNNSKSIEMCDDKSKTYITLFNKNINQPLTIVSPLIFSDSVASYDDFIEYSIERLKFPIVIKECFGSFGKQVYLANNKNELISIIKSINIKPFILQEFISTSFGKDIRIEVIGDEVVASVMRVNENDFRANITNGGKAYVYEPNDKQRDMALKVTKYLNLDFAGIDILFGKNDEPILCEVNSNAYPLNVQNIMGINIVSKTLEYILREIK